MSTPEEKIANAILQEERVEKIGNKEIKVTQPTVATLIQVSKLISELPNVELERNQIVSGTLMIAKNTEIIGVIIATLILGYKKNTNTNGFLEKALKRLKIGQAYRIEKLGCEILNECSPKEINELIAKLLNFFDINFFFATITSLLDVNILRKTKGLD